MASIEFIQKRITGKQAELEKLTKKLERIRKAEAGNWEANNPYGYSGYDLKWCLKDIKEVQKALAGYQAQLVTATEKANSRNVKVIIDFLKMWKHRVRNYYMTGLEAYYKDKATVHAAYTAYTEAQKSYGWNSQESKDAKARWEELERVFRIDCRGMYEKREAFNRWGRLEKYEAKVADGKYEYLKGYSDERTIEEAAAKLDKDLDEEANRKYDLIIERTNRIVGQITDASYLEIGAKHDLNGYIIGTKGKASIQTIGAGGYNIQCFHFRTLIHEVK